MSLTFGWDSLQLTSPLSDHKNCRRFSGQSEDQRYSGLFEIRYISNECRQSPAWLFTERRLRTSVLLRHVANRSILHTDLSVQKPVVILEGVVHSSLRERQQVEPLTLSAVIALWSSASAALEEAHRLGVTVGCLHPDNIMLLKCADDLNQSGTMQPDDPGQWKIDVTGLLDLPSDARRFIAPELVATAPDPAVVEQSDPAADVFSLAAVVGWLCENAGLSGQNPDPELETNPELKSLLSDCLHVDSLKRPSSADVIERLELLKVRKDADRAALSESYRKTLVVPASDSAVFDKTLQVTGLDEQRLQEYEKSLADRGAPRQLGRYTLQDQLGEGAVGTVYRGIDTLDRSTVAIKVLNSRVSSSAETLRRFAKEARLLAQVNNPYVANMLDFNQDGGVCYLVVEYVSGGTVADLLRKIRRLEESLALLLMMDVARGISVAHERGIVHRDIKPENLLLVIDGEQLKTADRQDAQPWVKVSDFGLARVDQQSESLAITSDGAILGTPLYMSPEQCRGTPADARSDVYSLGATLFHLIAGQPPFTGDSQIAVFHKHCHDPVPAIRQLRPEVSEATARVIEKCLAKNPDARYASATELLDDIERLVHGEPSSILMHPAIPKVQADGVLEFRFSVETNASPAQLWPYVSNTDRINHSLGLPPVTYKTRHDPLLGVQRFAETRIVGQKLIWQEHPYEWIEGRRMSVFREFLQGPFTWFVNIVELSPRSGGGTLIQQTFKVLPRNLTGRLLARFELGRRTPSSFRRAYRQIDDYLSREGQNDAADDAFGRTIQMSARQRAQLENRLERLRQQKLNPEVVAALGQFLEHGSDPEVARIRPLAFAERFRLPRDQVVDACLLGAREGLLTLLWDILCPSCRIPADVQETLTALMDHSYCPACDLKYEVDFANSVELIFRAHPELRSVETRTYCIGGPAFSSHVAAQTQLAPGERFTLELSLEEGAYRIRGPQLPFAVDVRVSPSGKTGRWELPLLRAPLQSAVPLLRTGSQVITLFNNTPRTIQVKLERTAGRQLALTAAAASSLAVFRQLFPDQVLSPGRIVSVTSITLLQCEVFDAERLFEDVGDGAAFGRLRESLQRIEQAVEQQSGAVVKIVGEGLLASFSDPLAAVRAALALRPDAESLTASRTALPLRTAIHRGPALVTTINSRLDYFGATTQLLRRLLREAGAGELVVSDAVASQSGFQSLLAESSGGAELFTLTAQTESIIGYRYRLRGERALL